jgi:hypothetical protein
MFSLEQLTFVGGTIAITFIVIYLAWHVWNLQRKYDLKCFIIGDFIFMFFMFLFFFAKLEDIPNLLSSLFIAELTLALVWVELSKRPELKLGSFCPIVYKKNVTELAYKAGFHDEPPEPSGFFGVKESSYNDLKFDEYSSFSIDLSNVGYMEVMVHEYIIYLDEKRMKPIPLGEPPYIERLKLITQGRHTIDLQSLHIESAGFHKLRLEVIATTIKCSGEVWFFISEDLKKLRYVDIYPLKKILAPLIKNGLKDP